MNITNFIDAMLTYQSTNRGGKSGTANIAIKPAHITVHHCFLTFSRPKPEARNGSTM